MTVTDEVGKAALEKMAEELSALQARYAEVQDSMGEGFIVLDENFRLVEINDEGLRLDGRSREQLLGRTHWELWPGSNGSAVESAYRKVMQDREPLSFRYHYAGHGQGIWLSIRVHPVARGIASLYKDVSDTVRAEEALRSSEARFRAAIDAIGVLWTNDSSGKMVGPQPGWAQLTGQTLEEYQDHGWAQAVHPEDAQPTIDAWQRAVDARSVFTHEHRVRRADGQWRKFAIRAVPITVGGSVVEWVGVHIDVTEAAASAAALQAADRRKDEFIATLAHELRNPLAPVRTAASLLARPDLTPDRLQWCADMIQRQVGNMAVLLDDLLDVSRITSGRLELRREAVEVADVIASAVEIARPLLDRKKHVLALDVAPRLPPLWVDKVRVTQILGNLLTNAAKYTDPGGRVHIGACASDDQITLEVADNGIGLAADSLPSLFEMFNQQTDAQGRSEGGLGIGLALTRGLVHLHGGSIDVHSSGLGTGSTFIVRLPTASPSPARADATTPNGDNETGGGKMVLVVDDNVDAANALAALLDLEGWRTAVAHHARQALEIAAQSRPVLALLDLGLPDISGYQLATMLRATDLGKDLRIAAISGWGQDADKARALAAGFDHHFTKPVDAAQLFTWLGRA